MRSNAVGHRQTEWGLPSGVAHHDADDITVVEKFSDTYFELVRENTHSENELLSSELHGERLLVQFCGRNYLIE